ncbi:hypothetical protein R6Z07_011473 [Ovis aries]
MNMAARRGPGLSGLAIAAGNARFVGSWVPVDWHPASRAQGCGPQNLGSGACKLQELFKGFVAPGRVESPTQELNPCSLHRKPSSEESLGKSRPGQSSLAPATLPDRASEQSWSSAVLEAHSAPAK